MNLTTRAHCIDDPPCEWTGTTDRSAEKHTKETGHATVSETIPNGGMTRRVVFWREHRAAPVTLLEAP